MSDPSPEAAFRVDDDGVHLPTGFEGSVDLYFDDHHAWSFAATGAHHRGDDTFVPWPRRMQPWLEGESRVRLVAGNGRELWTGDVLLGGAEGRVSFLDKQGVPVMIDKWGLLQRPFSGRDPSVVEEMVEVTEQILEVMREECGIEGWIAFGTLLGAAREGGVIGHDSDIDLAYLSRRETPAELITELHGVDRALRRRGFDVVEKSGSFITVVFAGKDGAQASVDVYACFHVGELLYETATVRARVPVSAIEPLTTMQFEGRSLPAPADHDRMLTVSYGPGWRVPDPSFKHTPGPEINRRFHDWFGSLMRHRRDWETWNTERVQDAAEAPHADFVAWVLGESGDEDRVIDVGCGTAGDALAMARAGRRVVGLDYARVARRPVLGRAAEEGLSLLFHQLNLYDVRDTLLRGAFISRDQKPGQRVVAARDVLETLDVDGLRNFWQLCAMTLRTGGQAFIEGVGASPGDCPGLRAAEGGGPRRPLDLRAIEAQAVRAGGRVVRREGVEAAIEAVRGKGEGPRRFRMIIDWPART